MSERTDEDIQKPLERRPKGARSMRLLAPIRQYSRSTHGASSSSPARSPSTSMVTSSAPPSKSRRKQYCTSAPDIWPTPAAALGCIQGIYLADLGHWGRFNAVFQEAMPEPLPVRTAVQAILLPGYLVEIEMWAVKVKG